MTDRSPAARNAQSGCCPRKTDSIQARHRSARSRPRSRTRSARPGCCVTPTSVDRSASCRSANDAGSRSRGSSSTVHRYCCSTSRPTTLGHPGRRAQPGPPRDSCLDRPGHPRPQPAPAGHILADADTHAHRRPAHPRSAIAPRPAPGPPATTIRPSNARAHAGADHPRALADQLNVAAALAGRS